VKLSLKWLCNVFLAVGLCLTALGSARASSVPTQATLADLLAGQDLLCGDKIFENFDDFFSVVAGGALPVDPALVNVSVLSPCHPVTLSPCHPRTAPG
jgi:hypothetical protein